MQATKAIIVKFALTPKNILFIDSLKHTKQLLIGLNTKIMFYRQLTLLTHLLYLTPPHPKNYLP